MNKIKLKTILFFTVFFLIVVLFISLFKYSLIDDSFITLSYARNIFTNHIWGMSQNAISNTATSPLNVILLAIIGTLVGNYIDGIVILSSLIILFIIIFLIKIFDKRMPIVIALGSIILFNPLFLSTLGLESLLYGLLITIIIYQLIKKNYKLIGLFLGFLTITRPDGILLLSVIIFYFILEKRKKEIKVILFYFLCIVIPWLFFSWIFLGSFIPLTFFIKVRQVWPSGIFYVIGPFLYFKKIFFPSLFSISPIFFLVILLILNRFKFDKNEKILLIFSSVYYFVYSLLRVPPYHWYYVPPLFSLILILGFQLKKLDRARITEIIILYFLTFLPFIVIVVLLFKGGYYLNEAPIHTNWASQSDYKKVANWIDENIAPNEKICIHSEIGTINYFVKNSSLSEDFVINDAFVKRILDKSKSKYTWLYPLLKTNFLFYKYSENNKPCKYILFSNQSEILDKNLLVLKSWHFNTKWVKNNFVIIIKSCVE
jgi:hypothetical protein